jgi:hypothetical protein
MKKLQMFLALFLTCSLTFNLSAQANWRILSTTGTTGQAYSHTPYNLQAIKGGAILAFQKRKGDMINLGWNSAGDPMSTFQIVKEGGGPILCGDKVALFNDRGNYIYYKKRTFGINLAFSSSTSAPIYEWEIRNASNVKATPIVLNEPIALYNSKANDFLKKCPRPSTPVVDLAWITDCPTRICRGIIDTTWNKRIKYDRITYGSKLQIDSLYR